MVLRIHGMDEVGVRFPLGPRILRPEGHREGNGSESRPVHNKF